jgi:hypothetical protein
MFVASCRLDDCGVRGVHDSLNDWGVPFECGSGSRPLYYKVLVILFSNILDFCIPEEYISFYSIGGEFGSLSSRKHGKYVYLCKNLRPWITLAFGVHDSAED